MLCGLGFLFACNGLFDADFWWHLRAGEWIIEHGTVPDLDPFTFGSADQHWIDLHRLFQVVLAHIYHAGGVPAVIVAQALVAAASVLAGLACRRAGTSMTVAVLCWLPVLFVMQSRFQTRPEMLSLLFLGVWLAIVSRLDERPRLAWLLPVVQLVWVNVHGLFILGPIVLGLWLVVRVGLVLRRRWYEPEPLTAESRRWWRQVGGATALVGVACFLNPYGIKGVLFPFVLFPKITDPANPYKNAIAEFYPPSKSFRDNDNIGQGYGLQPSRQENQFCFRLLLVFVPLSFVCPAAARLAGPPAGSPTDGKPSAATHPPLPWLAGSLLCVVLAAVDAARASRRRSRTGGRTSPTRSRWCFWHPASSSASVGSSGRIRRGGYWFRAGWPPPAGFGSDRRHVLDRARSGDGCSHVPGRSGRRTGPPGGVLVVGLAVRGNG